LPPGFKRSRRFPKHGLRILEKAQHRNCRDDVEAFRLKWEPSGVGALKDDVRTMVLCPRPSRVNHCTGGINTRHISTTLGKCEREGAIAAPNVKDHLAENIARQPKNESPFQPGRGGVDSGGILADRCARFPLHAH
jgi:hypothetical protein